MRIRVRRVIAYVVLGFGSCTFSILQHVFDPCGVISTSFRRSVLLRERQKRGEVLDFDGFCGE